MCDKLKENMDFAGESLEDRECLADSLRDGLMNKIREIWAGSPLGCFFMYPLRLRLLRLLYAILNLFLLGIWV